MITHYKFEHIEKYLEYCFDQIDNTLYFDVLGFGSWAVTLPYIDEDNIIYDDYFLQPYETELINEFMEFFNNLDNYDLQGIEEIEFERNEILKKTRIEKVNNVLDDGL